MMPASPLAGLNIVVTRPREQAAQLQRRIGELGGNAILFPLLDISPPADTASLQAALAHLADFDLAIFISPNAVQYGMAAINNAGGLPAQLRVATVGQSSAKALRDAGIAEVIAPQERFDSEALLALPPLQNVQNWKVAIFRGDGGRELLGDTLKQRGATVEYVTCYQRSKAQPNIDTLLHPHAITVSSSEALGYLWEMLDASARTRLCGVPLFVPHARIASLAQQQGWQNVILTAGGDDGVVSGLVAWSKERKISASESYMSEQAQQQPGENNTGTSHTTTPAPSHNPLVNLISRMSLTQMTLAVLVVIFLWQWLSAHSQINQVQQELATRLAEMDGVNKANQNLLAQNQEVVRELGGKLSLLESKYAEAQNQRAALEALYQEMSSSRDQTALAEVEQMLMIAGQQLQLSANVKAALIAMQHADDRLQRLDRPALAGLHKSISRDIDKLRALPIIDAAGINTRIDSVVAVIDTLPLSQDIRAHAEQPLPAPSVTESAWNKFWRELWQETKQLVRIENTQKQELPLLSPTQTFFLRENLKIRLLSARMALLSHDEVSYKRDLKNAQDWIKLYFDTQSKDSAQALTTLQKLAASNINIDMPDISGSLESVRNYRISHEKGAR